MIWLLKLNSAGRMNSSQNACYITAIIVFICSYPVSAIRCYQCSSYADPGCESIDPNATSPYLKKCESRQNSQIFCRKTVQTVIDGDFTRVTRSCGWIVHKTNASNCLMADTDFKKEISCQCFTDACNLGNFRAVLPTLSVVLGAAAISLIW